MQTRAALAVLLGVASDSLSLKNTLTLFGVESASLPPTDVVYNASEAQEEQGRTNET